MYALCSVVVKLIIVPFVLKNKPQKSNEHVHFLLIIGNCPTVDGEKCQFPYKDRFGQERNLCTRDPDEVFGVKDSKGEEVTEDSFQSFCPTVLDVKTRRVSQCVFPL